MHTNEQTEEERDSRMPPPNFQILFEKVLSYCQDERIISNEDYQLEFEYVINSLKLMKSIELRAGYQEIDDVIKDCGFPLQITTKHFYSWTELKHWLSDPTTAITVHIPGHACLLFAMACEKNTEKYR